MTVQQDASYVNVPTFEEMALAWNRVTRSARTEVKDWLALKIYGHPSHTSKYLSFILAKLQQREYEPADTYPFYNPKKDRSLRRFEFLDIDDRIVFQYLCNRLITFSFKTITGLNSSHRVYGNIPIDPDHKSPWLFQRPFNLRSSGFVLANGQYDLFRNRVLLSFDEFVRRKQQGWLVRTDIRSYYYSVDHNQLFKLIEKRGWLPDKADKDLLRKCLVKWAPESGKGIPVGYECSDYIGNLYLNDLDETLKYFRVHRYVDDTYIFVNDFEQVKDVLFRIDNTLNALGLQRNTSKTKTYQVSKLTRIDLQRMLRESLSTVADKREDELAEAKRQEKLRAILQESFDPKRASESEDDGFANFKNVAFVLNRITRQEVDIKETAYYVLDHDLEHSYHALKYLSDHAPDDRLTKKLKSILEADYEPRSLKALALYFLQLLDDHTVEDAVQAIVARSDSNDWHLLQSILKRVIEPYVEAYSRALLDSFAAYENPHVEVYARWLILEQCKEHAERCEQVNGMLASGNQHVKRLGIYLAHRDGLLDSVDASLLEGDLKSLIPEPILSDLENFRKEFYETFRILLAPSLRIGDFFGQISEIAPIMRVVYATKDQGAKEFVNSFYSFLEIVLSNLAARKTDGAKPADIDIALEILGDNRLYLLVSTLEELVRKEYVKEGIQDELIHRFKRGIKTSMSDELLLEEVEGEARNQVFISYARADEYWLDLLLEHWQPIEDYHTTLDIWSDKKIETGDNWREEINRALEMARVAVLLVSRPFLSSRFIHLVEWPALQAAAKKREVTVIWLPISPSNVDATPIIEYEAAWRDIEKTLVDMNEGDRERHLVQVTKKIASHSGVDLYSKASNSSESTQEKFGEKT